MFRAPALAIARERARHDAPTWLYRFAWPSPTMGGACHCLDVPFFFDCLAADRVDVIAGSAPPQELADDGARRGRAVHRDRRPRLDGRSTTPTSPPRVFDVPSEDVAHGYADAAALLPVDERA